MGLFMALAVCHLNYGYGALECMHGCMLRVGLGDVRQRDWELLSSSDQDSVYQILDGSMDHMELVNQITHSSCSQERERERLLRSCCMRISNINQYDLAKKTLDDQNRVRQWQANRMQENYVLQTINLYSYGSCLCWFGWGRGRLACCMCGDSNQCGTIQ